MSSNNNRKTLTAAHAIPEASQVGDRMPDGTIYAGISPETDRPLYAMPADAAGVVNWHYAHSYARALNDARYLGHENWRMPTARELSALFKNRAAIGGFDEADYPEPERDGHATARYPGHYWAAEGMPYYAHAMSFADGREWPFGMAKELRLSVRCVTDSRSEPQP